MEKRNILVVDDSPLILDMISNFLILLRHITDYAQINILIRYKAI